MGLGEDLPFEVGRLAEARSFDSGFRGAWFRCKIIDFRFKRGQLEYSLEYFDFPDEKITWTKLYERNPVDRASSREAKKMQMMMRPCYPSIYHENQKPDPLMASELIVVIDGAWKVGDLVDWWSDGCYWSGRVSKLLGDDKLQIELPEPPLGEGKSYAASYKDLRPSLNWSLEQRWSVPISEDTGTVRCCARLIQPLTHDKGRTDKDNIDKERTDKENINGAPPEFGQSGKGFQKQLSENGENDKTCTPSDSMNLDPKESGLQISNASNEPSSAHSKETVSSRQDRYNPHGALKKMRTSENQYLHTGSDTVESSLQDLEELVCKIKWLKDVLESRLQTSNAIKPHWKFFGS